MTAGGVLVESGVRGKGSVNANSTATSVTAIVKGIHTTVNETSVAEAAAAAAAAAATIVDEADATMSEMRVIARSEIEETGTGIAMAVAAGGEVHQGPARVKTPRHRRRQQLNVRRQKRRLRPTPTLSVVALMQLETGHQQLASRRRMSIHSNRVAAAAVAIRQHFHRLLTSSSATASSLAVPTMGRPPRRWARRLGAVECRSGCGVSLRAPLRLLKDEVGSSAVLLRRRIAGLLALAVLMMPRRPTRRRRRHPCTHQGGTALRHEKQQQSPRRPATAASSAVSPIDWQAGLAMQWEAAAAAIMPQEVARPCLLTLHRSQQQPWTAVPMPSVLV